MQMNSSELHVYQQESNQFLHQKIEWHNFPIKPRQSIDDQQIPNTSKNSQSKRKGIVKQPKQESPKTKKLKRQKDEKNISQMGRPSNENIQKDHLVENRSFNDIVYHFSRMLIFLKLKQGIQNSNYALLLQNHQSDWMSQTQNIMSRQNFPAFEQQKPIFLLHPNSLHFVFQYRKQKEGLVNYTEQEVKYMLFAFLKKRGMLVSTVYHYVNNYWPDIIYLVNNPEGDVQYDSQNNNQIEIFDMVSSQELQERQNVNNNIIKQKHIESQSSKQKKKSNKQISQIQVLKKQLQEDDSIAAYQISCYLHACCIKFQIKIGNDF